MRSTAEKCADLKPMPVADYKTYCTMLDRARAARFALPAVNVTSLTTANAVLRGLTESKADGIIQISTGGGAFASGTTINVPCREGETVSHFPRQRDGQRFLHDDRHYLRTILLVLPTRPRAASRTCGSDIR